MAFARSGVWVTPWVIVIFAHFFSFLMTLARLWSDCLHWSFTCNSDFLHKSFIIYNLSTIFIERIYANVKNSRCLLNWLWISSIHITQYEGIISISFVAFAYKSFPRSQLGFPSWEAKFQESKCPSHWLWISSLLEGVQVSYTSGMICLV